MKLSYYVKRKRKDEPAGIFMPSVEKFKIILAYDEICTLYLLSALIFFCANVLFSIKVH